MTRWPSRRRAVLVAVAVVLGGALGVSACTGGSSPDRPIPSAAAHDVRYVSLGGDDAFGRRNRLTGSWPQRLFREGLPVGAVFVNLANRRSGVVEIRDEQVEDALRLKPNVVTITLQDDLERGTSSAQVEADLAAIIGRLKVLPDIEVLVGTAPATTGAPEAQVAFDAAITAAVRAGGATLVDLGGVDGSNGEARAQQIAAAFRARLDPRVEAPASGKSDDTR